MNEIAVLHSVAFPTSVVVSTLQNSLSWEWLNMKPTCAEQVCQLVILVSFGTLV